MRCVDLALKLLIERSGLPIRVDFFCFDLPHDLRTSPDPIRYRSILELGEISEYNALIIWGDFLLARDWLDAIIPRLAKASGCEEATVRQKVYKTLFPPAVAPSRPVTIVFGQCLLLGCSNIFQDQAYVSGLRSLLRSAVVASMRDAISAARASAISGLPVSSHSGVDAALLLEPLGFDTGECTGSARPLSSRIGVFFGRTHSASMTKVALAASLRKRAPRPEVVWISWMPKKSMPVWIRALFRIREVIKFHSVEDSIQAIRACRVVITDSYHLALISWSYGVPAICIGRGAQRFQRTVHDKKKEIFFSSNFLDEFYLFAEHELGNLSGASTKALTRAFDPELGVAVRQHLHRISDHYVRMLTLVLAKLVAAPPHSLT
jgi:hypothetical protein